MKKAAAPLAFALVLAAAALALLLSPPGARLEEDLGLALLFRLRGPAKPPADVVIVNVDEDSAEVFGFPENPYKWSRTVYAELIDRLLELEAAVIVFDVHFADPKDPLDDARFAEAIGRAGKVILVQRLLRKQIDGPASPSSDPAIDLEVLVSPVPVLADAALAMAPFPLPKVPVRVNQAWTFKGSMGGVPTLPVVALQVLALSRGDQVVDCLGANGAAAAADTDLVEAMRQNRIHALQSGAAPGEGHPRPPACAGLTDSEQGLVRALLDTYRGDSHIFVNFYGPPSTLATVPMHRLVRAQGGDTEELRPLVRDRVVFVGAARTSWSEQKDGFHTVFTRADGLDLSGVEIAATVFANLRDGRALQVLPLPATALLLLAVALTATLLGFLLSPLAAAAAFVLFIAAGLGAACLLIAGPALWPPLIIPFAVMPASAYLGSIIFKYLRSRRQRAHMQKALRLYLPEGVVEEISNDLDFVTSGDRMIYGACLLSDAENYTSLSERLSPGQLSVVMKDYYGLLFGQVQGHGGTVTNMIGDSMFALWPSTEPKAELKAKACQAALAMTEALNEFNKTHPEHALPTRVGLHAGYLLMGHIGAAGHYEYAPVGDIVNTASRIEGLNKRLGTRLLASAEAVAEGEGFSTRLLGSFLLSGKIRAVAIHQLLPAELPAAVQHMHRSLFPEARALFLNRNWAQAEALFLRCLEVQPDDGPARFYLERCRAYRRRPPAADWQGVIPVGK